MKYSPSKAASVASGICVQSKGLRCREDIIKLIARECLLHGGVEANASSIFELNMETHCLWIDVGTAQATVLGMH